MDILVMISAIIVSASFVGCITQPGDTIDYYGQ